MDSLLTYLKKGLVRSLPGDRIHDGKTHPGAAESLRNLLPYVLRHWRDGLLSVSLILLGALFVLPQPLITRYIIDDVILERRPGLLIGAVVLLALIALGGKLAEFLEPFYSKRFEQRVSLDLQQDLVDRTLELPKRFFDDHQTGYLMSRLTADIEEVHWFFSGTVVQIVSNSVRLVGGVFLLFYLEWRLAVAVLLVLPGILFGVRYFSRKIHALSHHMMERGALVTGRLQESIATFPLIKAFSSENRTVERLMRLLRAEYRISLEGTAVGSLSALAIAAVPAVARMMVLAGGAYLVILDRWTLGSLLAFQIYLGYVFSPVQFLASSNMDLQRAMAALQRVSALFNIAVEENIGKGQVVNHLEGRVVFENVSFSYDGKEPVIDNLSVAIRSGERIAIVGPSGIGKTTLLSLILRFYTPTAGEIYFDDKPASAFEVRSLRRRIGYVSQQALLLSGTIMENLQYGNDAADPDDIDKAAKAAGIHRFIRGLPDGYETRIGENGVNLSEGQKQRLALARALVRKPDILVLDEPTSAVDSVTEESIFQSLPSAAGGKSVFVVTHRLSAIRHADRILLFEENRFVTTGTHETLMTGNAYYRTLVNGQESEGRLSDRDKNGINGR